MYHNLIFRFRDDVGFMGIDGTIHSLNATASFGDYHEATLSRPINGWLRDHLNVDRCRFGSAATDVSRGCVLFVLPIDTAPFPNAAICMYYKFGDQVRWAYQKNYNLTCVASVIDSGSNNQPTLMGGGEDGFVRRLYQTDRSIDGTDAYETKITLPHLHFGTPQNMKTFYNASFSIQPRGSYDFTFNWTRDDHTQQTRTIAQGGSDVLSDARDWLADFFSDIGGVQVFRKLIPPVAHGAEVGDQLVLNGYTTGDGTYLITKIRNAFVLEIEAPTGSITGTGTEQITSISNPFILDTSTLGGSRFVEQFVELEEGGEFRSVEFEFVQGGLNEDLELHGFAATLTRGADSLENN
jgi:hypothetical protein